MESVARPWQLYERHAALWTQLRQPGLTLERTWLTRFCEQLEPNAAVLDIGCGRGQPIGAHLLHQGFEVSGIDRSPALIEAARTALPAGDWHVGDMTTFDLDRTFAGIVIWHSLFHLTAADQRKVFPLLATHSQPGAPLLFTAGPEAGSANGCLGGETLVHHSLDPGEYEDLLGAANFTVVDYRETDPDCGNATVWFARKNAPT